MRPEIKAYLDISRGSKNYKLSVDDVVTSLSNYLSTTLDKHSIEVVVIWSTIAKNELVTCRNGVKTIIWDTNYWVHFAYYYKNVESIEQHIQHNSPFVELQCDALWQDLFRIALFRVAPSSPKHQLQFAKYYLSYGKRSFPWENTSIPHAQRIYNRMVDMATAKQYAFFHEIAHITAETSEDYDNYIGILKAFFAAELQETIYTLVIDGDKYSTQVKKDMLRKHLDEMTAELLDGNYTKFNEIIADMRAIHSICSNYPPDIFTRFKYGIACQRSFSLRIRNIEACLREFIRTNDLSIALIQTLNSQFGMDFAIRDSISEFSEIPIISASYFTTIPSADELRAYLESYKQTPVFSTKTADAISQSIGNHLLKLFDVIAHEGNSLLPPICGSSEIMDYLLSHPNQDHDQRVVNQPTSVFGWTGLFFDEVSINQKDSTVSQ